MNGLGGRAFASLTTLLLVGILFVVPASAEPIAAASVSPPASGQWAFGAQHNVSATGTAADGNTSFSLHASYGWNTILTQRNGSAGNFEIEVNRTVGASLFVTYCRPDCNAATRSLNISEHVWETEVAFANLTSRGTAYALGNTVPAIALENSSVRQRGNLTESATAVVDTLRGKATATQHLSVGTSGSASVSFTPALGLFPENLTWTAWNSSAHYTASGSWSVVVSYASIPFFGVPTMGARSYPGSFTGAQGTVGVSGTTDGPRTLANGESTTQVDLSISGPFTSWEGIVLVPNDADLLAATSAPWAPDALGSQFAVPQTIDVQGASSLGHLPLLASATRYQPSATDSGAISLDTGMTTALTGPGSTGGNGSSPMDGPPASTVQAQPETVSSAEHSSNCLIAGCGPGVSALPIERGWALGIALVLIAVVVAIVLVKRQPPRTESPSRNAALYPRTPVGEAVPPPKSPGIGKSPPDGEAPDPLSNLW
ncbi:MAG TPA: hypothetical protein VGS23_00920 [Thermoplasmata archaeon]|nr:hypothetical protein [Thermoplasmata archaeon]